MVARYKIKYRGSGSVAKSEQPKQHGGSRPGNPNGKRGGNNGGAGRPLGLPNMKSREIKEIAALSGELPHEFLLRICRSMVGATISGHTIDWEDIFRAALGCVNYYAPKLSAVNVSGKTATSVQVLHIDPTMLQGCTIDELNVLEKVFGRFEAAQSNTERTDLSLIDATVYSKTLQ